MPFGVGLRTVFRQFLISPINTATSRNRTHEDARGAIFQGQMVFIFRGLSDNIVFTTAFLSAFRFSFYFGSITSFYLLNPKSQRV